MREILFRGKDKNIGKWVTGNLYQNQDQCFIMANNRNNEVIPETVGQYTGNTDKKRVKIFEGDIAKFKRFENTYIGKIVFNPETAGFEFWWNVKVGAYGEMATRRANMSVCDDIEIIGNIHDNPELLEQEG